MSNALLVLREFFPTGTAEGDAAILNDAFVVPAEYFQIVDPPKHSPRILVGKKGSGKSAIVQAIKLRSEAGGIPAIVLRPDDVPSVQGAADMGTLKRHALGALVGALALKLGETLSGLVTGADARLLKNAMDKGAKSPDTVQKLLKLLLPVGTVAANIDFGRFLPAAPDASAKQLFDAAKANLSKEERLFFLLLDDTDQFAAPDASDQLNRIWAFLLAARQLSAEVPNVRCVVTLRTEIWTRLKSDKGGQRDQVDHFRPLVIDYNPTDNHIERVLERRLALARKKLGVAPGRPLYEPFFADSSVTLPTSTEHRAWPDFLVKSSRERPRDAIQFVEALTKSALEHREEKISSATVDRCMPQYSDERAQDLALEFERDCPQMLAVVDTFSKMPFKMSAELARKHLTELPSAFSITVRGQTLQPDRPEHVLTLWRLLHEAGFLNPRWADAREDKNFRHGSFKQDPDLVSPSRLNDVLRAEWEVHPAYRQHLLKLRHNEAARLGVSPAALVRQQ